MSRETMDWLNTMTRIGFTATRGNAWHYRQGATNHFPDAVPMDEVLDLFGFNVVPRDVYILIPGDESTPDRYVRVDDRVAQVRDDNDATLGIFKDSYEGHGYQEWLLSNVSNLLSDDLGIGSAGLLKGGAQAWVQVEMPDSIMTPEGVAFKSTLMATTSFDGSLATTYKPVNQIVVCDNTRDAAMAEKGSQFKVRHTRHSKLRLTDAREALGIVHSMAEDFAAEVAELCATTVTDKQWNDFLNELSPLPEKEGTSYTVSEKRRDALTNLYRTDDRCAPWVGTAFGVLQATNTYGQHMTQVRKGADRWERIITNTLKGAYAKDDANTLQILSAVLAK